MTRTFFHFWKKFSNKRKRLAVLSDINILLQKRNLITKDFTIKLENRNITAPINSLLLEHKEMVEEIELIIKSFNIRTRRPRHVEYKIPAIVISEFLY